MKNRTAFILFLIGFLFQSTLGQNVNIMGVSPNYLLCLTVLFSFLYKGNQGIVLGIFFGLLQDINFSALIGPSAIIYFFIALVMSEIRHYLYRDSMLNLFFASSIGTVLYYGSYWLIYMVFKGNYSFFYILKWIPILLLYHFIIVVAFYMVVGKKTIKHRKDRYYKGRKLYIS